MPDHTPAAHTHSQMPKASDQLLIQKLYHTHEGRNGHFSKPRTSISAFQVHHYAGVVEYESEGFVGKNDDSVIEEHISLLRSSKVSAEWCSTV